MNIKVQLVIEDGSEHDPLVQEVACFSRQTLTPETLGLTLAEAKTLLAQVQETMAGQQVADYLDHQHQCPACGRPCARKGQHTIVYRTLFGTLHLSSPRYYTCRCQDHRLEHNSWSPLAVLLPERTAPELLYLEAKWASLMSYGLTIEHLAEVLPLDTTVNTTSLRRHVQQVAERLEGALGEEQWAFVEGCQRDWDALPRPDGPLTVGVDGGYVHGRDEQQRKAGTFEVIVGKSIPSEGAAKCFGFVVGHDHKPKRRLFEVLKAQGMQMNQSITFLSDGGESVRDLQLYLCPESEHILDWFHVTMRLTVMQQLAKGVPKPANTPEQKTVAAQLERIKWYLWHGNVFRALQEIEALEWELDEIEQGTEPLKKLAKAVREFGRYIESNEAFIPNYGERYRYGEAISSAMAESTVNQLVSKRFEKKQQMRWTKQGAHLLLQVRIQVCNGDLRATFDQWYPQLQGEPSIEARAA